MTKYFSLNTDGLFSQEQDYAVPHNKDFPASESLKRFQTWTTDSSSKIFSGYRKQSLAEYGLKEAIAAGEEWRKKFETLVVLGIGGSALGAKTALSALEWSVPKSERRKVYFAENVDPLDFGEMWESLDLKKTAFALITKSGGTLETMAQASLVFEELKKQGLKISDHVIAITDPSKGSLRSWATKENLKTLAVPSDVGGRFSVLTPVGTFALKFAGIDVAALVQGANDFYKGELVAEHTMQKLAWRVKEYEDAGFAAHNLMPYSTVLRNFGLWFVQLWGESLGKTVQCSGAVPLASVGATDQHSLLQLLVDGPNRILNAFVEIKKWPATVSGFVPKMQKLSSEFNELEFAQGKTFGEILNVELEATYQVLKDQLKRPVYRLTLETLDAKSVGALFAFYMDLCVRVASCHDINPFDQPGVEHGKKMMPKIMGALK